LNRHFFLSVFPAKFPICATDAEVLNITAPRLHSRSPAFAPQA
jgi:hypothetical protein